MNSRSRRRSQPWRDLRRGSLLSPRRCRCARGGHGIEKIVKVVVGLLRSRSRHCGIRRRRGRSVHLRTERGHRRRSSWRGLCSESSRSRSRRRREGRDRASRRPSSRSRSRRRRRLGLVQSRDGRNGTKALAERVERIKRLRAGTLPDWGPSWSCRQGADQTAKVILGRGLGDLRG